MNIPQKYFNRLGIAPTTNKAIIKKAYRKLAFKYHPDVNSSEQAHQQFIEITEAYEICLGDREVKSKGQTVVKKTTQQEREERMQRAREFYKQAKIKEEEENKAFFENLISGKKWQFLKVFSVVSALFAFLIVVDYILPSREEKGIMYSFAYHNRNLSVNINNETYFLNTNSIEMSTYSKHVVLKRSLIFNDVKEIIFINAYNKLIPTTPVWSFFELFWIFVILFLLPIIVVLYKKQTPLFTFLYSISLYVVPIIFLIILLSRNRIGLF